MREGKDVSKEAAVPSGKKGHTQIVNTSCSLTDLQDSFLSSRKYSKKANKV